MAAMVGAGIHSNDTVMDGTGTVVCMLVLFDGILRGQSLLSMDILSRRMQTADMPVTRFPTLVV